MVAKLPNRSGEAILEAGGEADTSHSESEGEVEVGLDRRCPPPPCLLSILDISFKIFTAVYCSITLPFQGVELKKSRILEKFWKGISKAMAS